jgi:MoaA/NifB/PqqE/SkfB family radical SAM enzyme
MFKFTELKQIHLEITNNCQASCPMCVRNDHGAENPLITIRSWTLLEFKIIINSEVLAQIEELYFCGNYGDPLLNNDLIAMIEYAVSINPKLKMRVHTNGSLRNTEWWRKLAAALPSNHCVVFAIDGLSETHSIYRIGTSFEKIIENAQAFIQAGGIADWAFIRFKHNEHEVETAKVLASNLGFSSFVMKDSSRFMLDSKFPVYDKETKSTIRHLEPSQYSELKFMDRNIIAKYKDIAKSSTIDCYAIKNKEIFIDAFCNVYPCCFIAMTPYMIWDKASELSHIRREILAQYDELLADFGGLHALSSVTQTIKSIIDSSTYQNIWKKYWTDPKMITCARTCGVNQLAKPFDQFTKRENLNA